MLLRCDAEKKILQNDVVICVVTEPRAGGLALFDVIWNCDIIHDCIPHFLKLHAPAGVFRFF